MLFELIEIKDIISKEPLRMAKENPETYLKILKMTYRENKSFKDVVIFLQKEYGERTESLLLV